VIYRLTGMIVVVGNTAIWDEPSAIGRSGAPKACHEIGVLGTRLAVTAPTSERSFWVWQVQRCGGPSSNSMCVAVVDDSRFTECRAKAGDFVVLQRN
jgi:hypothetical protein